MPILSARVGSDNYPVVVSDHALDDLTVFCSNYSRTNLLIISDVCFKNPSLSYPQLDSLFSIYPSLFIDGGIESKGLLGYESLIKWVISHKLPRDGVLLAVGGGVVGDLVAFVASTYLRGVGLVHVPTTTTSMIDSAIGGKTGLNFDQQVNSIGTYYNPKAVFMDIRFLQTLSPRDYNSGLCESIKMALTSSSKMVFHFLNNSSYLCSENRDLEYLIRIITWSIKMKLFHVSDDSHEKGIRLILNYGHTFGQAIETHYGLTQDNLRHGEAVSLGIICASVAIDNIENTVDTSRVKLLTSELLSSYDLPLKIPSSSSPTIQILVNNLINDKKRTSQGNRFILTPSLGNAETRFISDLDILSSSFSEVLN